MVCLEVSLHSRGRDPFPLPKPWPFSKTGKGCCEWQWQHFNWMGFIINVSLSEDFCLICLSRPFGRNCRGTEEEQHIVFGSQWAQTRKCQLLCLKVAVFFKRLKEIWFLSSELCCRCRRTAFGTILVIIMVSTSSSLHSWVFLLIKMMLFYKGTQPWRGDEIWINIFKFVFEWED